MGWSWRSGGFTVKKRKFTPVKDIQSFGKGPSSGKRRDSEATHIRGAGHPARMLGGVGDRGGGCPEVVLPRERRAPHPQDPLYGVLRTPARPSRN